MSSRILLIDDEKELERLAEVFATDAEIDIVLAHDDRTAEEIAGTQPIDLIVVNETIRHGDSIELIGQLHKRFPEIQQILLTQAAQEDHASIMRVLDRRLPIVSKPWDAETLRGTVQDTLARRGMSQDELDLLDHGDLTLKQIKRGRRVQQRMHKTRPLEEVLVELGLLTRTRFDSIVAVRRSRMSIVELLRADNLLSDEELLAYEQARTENPGADERQLLVEDKLISEESYLRALCSQHGIPYTEPEVGVVDTALLSKTSIRYLIREKVLPVFRIDGKLATILADPLNMELRNELERIFDAPIDPRCCCSEKIVEALRTLDRPRGGGDESLSLQYREIDDVVSAEETGEEAVQIVDYLLARAIQVGASDLHIEPQAAKVRVRVRVDGVLQQLTDLPSEFAPRVVSRIKILAGADIAEKRLHQDGKIFVKIEGREIDIRVSTYVTVHGETIVMRLLDRNKGILTLEQIGFTPRAYSALNDIVLETSSGLVLLVGPTGSGKTSTLYGFINHANDPAEKVITCEDPVEFVIDGIVQCSVNSKTGPTFPDSLRAIVRQDPDTIVVGEIRDEITVGLALESALTGHKVFSTFHTEDAVGAFIRMLEMGAEPFLVASTVAAIVAQRLVRRLCPKCKVPADPAPSDLRFLGIDRSELRGNRFFTAGGCPECAGTGFKGRRAIHEVLIPDDDLRDAVMHRSTAKQLRDHARRLHDFLTLQEDGVLKALAGETSLAEIVANAPRDTSARPLSELKMHTQVGRSKS